MRRREMDEQVFERMLREGKITAEDILRQTAAEKVDGMTAGRRDFIKKATYLAPAILTLAVAPAYAKAGSVKKLKKADRGERKSRRSRERG
jgi:hypothetical protein